MFQNGKNTHLIILHAIVTDFNAVIAADTVVAHTSHLTGIFSKMQKLNAVFRQILLKKVKCTRSSRKWIALSIPYTVNWTILRVDFGIFQLNLVRICCIRVDWNICNENFGCRQFRDKDFYCAQAARIDSRTRTFNCWKINICR